MKKYLIFFFLAVLLASTATAQTSSENKITLREGETLKVGVKITGLDSVSRAGATFRDVSSPAKIIKSWTTADGSMTLVGDSVYVFTMTSLETTGKATPGRWQFEVQSGAIGVRKTDVFPLEIYRAASLTGGATPVLPGGYNYLFEFDFTATSPEFSAIESGIIIVDDMSISSALNLKQDISTLPASVRSTTLTGLSTASSAVVTSSSTVLGALGQLQAQTNLKVKYTIAATAAAAYALTADANTVTIIEVTADEINNSGSPSRYELWPSGNLWWGAFIRLR